MALERLASGLASCLVSSLSTDYLAGASFTFAAARAHADVFPLLYLILPVDCKMFTPFYDKARMEGVRRLIAGTAINEIIWCHFKHFYTTIAIAQYLLFLLQLHREGSQRSK